MLSIRKLAGLMCAAWLALGAMAIVADAQTSASQAPSGQASPAQPSSSEIAARARAVLSDLSARHFDTVSAQFSSEVAATLPADKLAQVWDGLLEKVGPLKSIGNASVTQESKYQVAMLPCVFEKMNLDAVVAFDSSGKIVGLSFRRPDGAPPAESWTAPAYADSSKFHEEAVTVTDSKWQLPGTLTLPDGKGPFSALVLVSGSGPNDADETLGPNKPFKDLAWGLASQGIAVLRYTKRTRQYGAASISDFDMFTVKDEYLDDARAAVALLAARPDIDAHHIYLAGHSEGGYIAPRIAAGDTQIAGIAILEGNTQSLEKLVLAQLHYQESLGGPNAAEIEKMLPQVEEQAKEIESPDLKPGTTLTLLGAKIPASYFLDLRSYDPPAVAAKLNIPILVVQGGRDFQVTTTDYAAWQKALAGRANVTFKLFPDTNHIMISGTGPSTPQEYANPGHVAPEIVDAIAAWIGAAKSE